MTAWCPLCDEAEAAPLAVGVGEAVVGETAVGEALGAVGEPPERYAGRYRVPSARLPGFDYGRGVFFVTIVTAGRVPWFGRIVDGRPRLSPAGRVVVAEWTRTGDLRADVTLDAVVVMPDHVHGILALDGGGDAGIVPRTETPHRGVSTADGGRTWRPGVLGAVIGRWKSECTRRIRQEHPDFAWQARFHEVIIRDDRHLESARRYIADNPARAPRS